MVASVTAIGGGTVRDILLGHYPIGWVKNPQFLVITCIAGVLTTWIGPWVAKNHRFFVLLDAIGLIVFSIIGSQVALDMGLHPLICVVAAIVTGVFGGLLRDLFCRQQPMVLHKELYASVSLLSAVLYIGLLHFGSFSLEHQNHALVVINLADLALTFEVDVVKHARVTMAIGGTLLFIQFIHRIQFKNAIYVPLIGIIFGNVVSSAATFVAYKYDAVQNLSAWTVANFANILQGNYELLYIAIPISVISYWYATRLSAVGMGKDFATNIGLNYKQILFLGIILVSVMSATVVMIVGQLPFLGLIVPNLVAQFYGDNLRRNIPLTAIVGAILILACDVVGRVIIFPYEIPISMIISILGGMVFIFFIVKGKQNV